MKTNAIVLAALSNYCVRYLHATSCVYRSLVPVGLPCSRFPSTVPRARHCPAAWPTRLDAPPTGYAPASTRLEPGLGEEAGRLLSRPPSLDQSKLEAKVLIEVVGRARVDLSLCTLCTVFFLAQLS